MLTAMTLDNRHGITRWIRDRHPVVKHSTQTTPP
jgi:hypothetical protein